jgi:tetratricopeptide (TPR) repeat protein
LADLGKAYLSALVHPHATGFGFVLAVSRMKDGRLRSVLERESAHLVSTTPEFLRHIWVILQKLQADFPITNNPVIKGEIPAILKSFLKRSHPNSAERQPEMIEPVKKTLEFLEALGAEWRRTRLDYNYSWRGDEWLAEQTKALGGTTTFVTLLQALEIGRTSDTLCSSLVFNIERLVETEQQKVSLDFIAEFHHAFVSERIRQLEDMKQAMYRFVEAVYHPHALVTYFVSPADQERCTLQHEEAVLSQKVAIQEQLAMHYEQGKQHYLARRYQEALTSFEQVLRYRSDFSPALYRIACIYALQGKVKPAVAYFKKLLLSVLTIENWRKRLMLLIKYVRTKVFGIYWKDTRPKV